MAINLAPGSKIRRTKLHEEYGGRRQGGISPSKQSDNVFLITAPDKGELYGYIYDGQGDDGFYHYTGEGQIGQQQMTQGNRAIRDHEAEDRELHLFRANGTELTYVGQFRYVDDYAADAKDVRDEELRKVIVFRLEQLTGSDDDLAHRRLDRLGHDPIKEIPVEQALTERMLVAGDREPYEAERREQTLVLWQADRLEREGHDVCRLQFLPKGEAAPLFCDLYDKTKKALYEAKGTTTRVAMRMAIGQLADYARFVDVERRIVLMPEKPRPDLVGLAKSQGIEVMHPDGPLS